MTVTLIPYEPAIVQPILTDVYRRWQDYVEMDDLRSTAMIWWFGKGQQYLPEYLEDENHVRLRRSIWRFVARFAQAEKAAKVGYFPTDQYRYTPIEVAALLGAALDPDMQLGSAPPSDGRRAVEALAEDDIQFLQLVDDVRGDHERAGELLAIQPDSVRRRYTRVIERMCRWLNNEENYA